LQAAIVDGVAAPVTRECGGLGAGRAAGSSGVNDLPAF